MDQLPSDSEMGESGLFSFLEKYYILLTMRRYSAILMLLGLILASCSSNPPERPADTSFYDREDLGKFLSASAEPQYNEYIISVGDRLDVVFLHHSDLTNRDLVVRSDGRISLPYLGDVMAAGTRPMELDSVLTVRFTEILRQPDISVIIRSSADKMVYVLGEVQQPGGFKYESYVSLVQSIALAGGSTPKAKLDRTVVIRREGMAKIVGVEVNVKAIMNGEMIQNDFPLRRNDIIYVPKKGINSLAEFIETFESVIRPPVDLYHSGWEIRQMAKSYEFYLNRLEND